MTQTAEQKGWALLDAIEDFRTDDAVELVFAGADLYVQEPSFISHAFHHAAKRDNLKVAEAILAVGYDVNTVAERAQGNGPTALIVAVSEGLHDMTEFLLVNKADPNIATGSGVQNGDAVNQWARSLKCDPEIFKLLAAYGAKVDKLAGDGKTAFEFLHKIYIDPWMDLVSKRIEPSYKALLVEVSKATAMKGSVVQAPVVLMPKIKLRSRA